jgi:hypothetical protein
MKSHSKINQKHKKIAENYSEFLPKAKRKVSKIKRINLFP